MFKAFHFIAGIQYNPQKIDATGLLDLEGKAIEQVDAFKYLGSIKTSNGGCEQDITVEQGLR